MIATITSIELKGPFHYFALSIRAMKIVKQLRRTNHLAFKSRGFWTKHYTMTLWSSKEEMKNFATSGNHKKAMQYSQQLAKEIRTVTIEAGELPTWSRAQQLLTKGKVIHFN